MKMSKKIVLRMIPVVLVLMLVLTTQVFGFADFNTATAPTANTTTKMVTSVSRVWGVVLTILQVAAIAAVVFAGVRYMFSSADSKAEIKKSMGILAIGAVLVFGASTVITFLTNSVNEITK